MPTHMPQTNPLAVLVMLMLFGAIIIAWISFMLRVAFQLPILPNITPRIVPWGARSVLAAFLLWVALQLTVPSLYFSIFRTKAADGAASTRASLSPGEMMTLSAVQNAATLALIPLLLAATSGARFRDFGLVRQGVGRQVVRGVAAYPLLAPIVFSFMAASVLYWGKTPHPLEDAIVQDRTPMMVAILTLAGVVFAPIAEEVIFRGLFLGWLTKVALSVKTPISPAPIEGAPASWQTETEAPKELNPFAPPLAPISTRFTETMADPSTRVVPLLLANMVVSLVFAALHGAVWPTPIPIFFLSIGLGVLYQRTGGIIAPIVLHMTFNGLSTLLMFLTLGSTPAPKTSPIPPKTVSAPFPKTSQALSILEFNANP